MSRKLTHFFSFVLLAGLFLASEANAADRNPVGWWELDGDATDSSGNDRHGTLMNTPGFVDGMFGQAVDLDGYSQYVVMTDYKGVLGTSPFTITAWINTTMTSDAELVSWGRPKNGGDVVSFWFGAGGKIHLGVWAGKVSGSTQINDGQWHHIAATVQENSTISYPDVTLYVDGQDDTIPSTGARSINLVSQYDVTIGRQINDALGFYDGLIDDVRIYDTELSMAEVQAVMANELYLYAHNAKPKDGDIISTDTVSLTWDAGAFAAMHDVYFADNSEAVNSAQSTDPMGADHVYRARQTGTIYPAAFPNLMAVEFGKTYYWRIDEVNDVGEPYVRRGEIWSFSVQSVTAYNPQPQDGSEYVNPYTELNWSPGATAVSHLIYFGDNYTSLNNITPGNTGVPEFQGEQTATVWDPYDINPLERGKTYYWRIDEMEADLTTFQKGAVWSLTTSPYIPIADPNLVGWWTFDEGLSDVVVDYSGYDHHGTPMGNPSFVDGMIGQALELDGSSQSVAMNGYKGVLGTNPFTITAWIKTTIMTNDAELVSWGRPVNGGDVVSFWLKQGKLSLAHWDGKVEGRTLVSDGQWHHVAATVQENSTISYPDVTLYVDGEDDTIPSTGSRAFDLGSQYDVTIGRVINAQALFYEGLLDDVRIYDKALTQDEIDHMRDSNLAWGPSPANGSTPNLDSVIPLTWLPGGMASMHDVYFGTDGTSVEGATTSTVGIYRGRQVATSYTPPDTLQALETYYWRIDEYNTDATVTKGSVWSFTLVNYLIVEDFEDYNDYTPDRIFETWIDGIGYTDPPPGNPGNGTGSVAGYMATPFAEQRYIHGGYQAMPMEYDNTRTPYYSETERTFATARDFTMHGCKALSLWFRGWPAFTGSFTESPPGTCTITASGADIGNVTPPRESGFHDEFHYAYQSVIAARITAIARVESIVQTDGWAKAGIMLRDSLDANSPHAFMYMTPANGPAFQYRTTAGGASTITNTTGIAMPQYIKLDIDPEGARGYYSPDGETWTQVGTQQIIDMTSPMYIGLAVTSHNAAATTTAIFTNVSITGGDGTWGHQDIGILSNDPEPMYVALQDSDNTAVVYHDDPNAILIYPYTEWRIDLKDFRDQGIDLKDVQSMYIGFGNRNSPTLGGSGIAYIDDIRLYQAEFYEPECDFWKPDLVRDGVINMEDLGVIADGWLNPPSSDPDNDLYSDGTIDFKDIAELGKVWGDEQVWPEW